MTRSIASLRLARSAVHIDGTRASISAFYRLFLTLLDDLRVEGSLCPSHVELCCLLERWDARGLHGDGDLAEEIRRLAFL